MRLAQVLYFIGFFGVLFGLFYPIALFVGLVFVIAGVSLYGYHYTKLLSDAETLLKKENQKRGKKK